MNKYYTKSGIFLRIEQKYAQEKVFFVHRTKVCTKKGVFCA